MKIRGLIAIAALAALVIPAGMAVAQSDVSKANGGGQIIEPGESGAGDTIAFHVADEAAPEGQIQYVDRTGGTGQGQVVRHGNPTCFVAEDNVAQIGVLWDDSTTSTIFITDNGSSSDDIVTVAPGSTPNCDDDEPDDTTTLSRGNVTIWDVQ